MDPKSLPKNQRNFFDRFSDEYREFLSCGDLEQYENAGFSIGEGGSEIKRFLPFSEVFLFASEHRYLPPGDFVVIGNDIGGNFLCINVRNGAIYWKDHEADPESTTEGLKRVASSLGHFLTELRYSEHDSTDPVEKLLREGALDEIKRFIESEGRSVKTRAGRNIVEEAARIGREDVVRLTLSLGVNPGDALIFAAMNDRRSIVDHLIQSGSDVNRPNSKGLTPLKAAFLYAEMQEYLRKEGAR